jgi:hypothetical protein
LQLTGFALAHGIKKIRRAAAVECRGRIRPLAVVKSQSETGLN